jgi:RecA/RadA recombinase
MGTLQDVNKTLNEAIFYSRKENDFGIDTINVSVSDNISNATVVFPVSVESVDDLPVFVFENSSKSCPSGWKNLDDVFVGGFPSGNVIQILGKASTGKTQLCLSTAISSARLSMKVLLIDTCNTVSLKRIQKLLQNTIINENNEASKRNEKLEIGKVYNDSLSNLHIERCFDLFSTFDLLTKSKQLKKFDIIIIDSLHQLFSQFIDYFDNTKYYNMQSSSVSSNYINNKNLLVNSNPLISNFYILLRSISAMGTTILVTNILETKKLSSQYSMVQSNYDSNNNDNNNNNNSKNKNYESGTGSIHNSVDIFDITIVMSIDDEFSSKTCTVFNAGFCLVFFTCYYFLFYYIIR